MQRHAFTSSPISAALVLALAGCSAETAEAPDTAEIAEPATSQSTASRDVSVSEAKALLEGDSAPVVLDVRTPEEFAAGHIEGATNINLMSGDFATEIAKLDKSEAYLLHCKSGSRSAKALAEMEAQGFENIAHMTEGYDGWSAASTSGAVSTSGAASAESAGK